MIKLKYPSCLILGFNKENIPIHVVCALSEDNLSMITAYNPGKEEWEVDFKTRR